MIESMLYPLEEIKDRPDVVGNFEDLARDKVRSFFEGEEIRGVLPELPGYAVRGDECPTVSFKQRVIRATTS